MFVPAGMRSDDGDRRRADVRGRRQLVVLLEAARRNADGRTAGGVRSTSGRLRRIRRLRRARQLPRLLRSVRGQRLLSLRCKSTTSDVKEADLYSAFIEVPYTPGAQYGSHSVTCKYTVPASTS